MCEGGEDGRVLWEGCVRVGGRGGRARNKDWVFMSGTLVNHFAILDGKWPMTSCYFWLWPGWCEGGGGGGGGCVRGGELCEGGEVCATMSGGEGGMLVGLGGGSGVWVGEGASLILIL